MTQPIVNNARKGKVLRIIDANTIDILFDLGFRVFTVERIQLARLNAPKRLSQEGMDATEFLKQQLTVPNVIVDTFPYPDNPDMPHSRDFMGEVWLDTGQNLTDLLIEKGHGTER